MTCAAAGARNWAMLVVLVALCALFYAITIVKMTKSQMSHDASHAATLSSYADECEWQSHHRHRTGVSSAMVGAVVRLGAAVPRVLRRHRLRRHTADRQGGRAGRHAAAHHRALQCQHQPEPAVGLPPGAGRDPLPLGDEHLAFYTARNEASTPVTGVALYNVTPDTVGKYFHKTACFCFNQQTLAAGQQMQFPLSFWVDPEIAKDPNTADIHTDHAVLHVLPHARRCGKVRRARAGRSACRSADAADPLNHGRFRDDAHNRLENIGSA